MTFRFPSVICTRCTGFFCLAIIKGPPNDIYCIIEEPYKHYFTEKVSYSLFSQIKLSVDSAKPQDWEWRVANTSGHFLLWFLLFEQVLLFLIL